MRDIPFEDVVAERALQLQRADGTSAEVSLQIGRPVPVAQYNIPSACPFRLVGLGKEEKFYAVGVDSVQALQLAFQAMAAWLDIKGKIYGGIFVAFGGTDHGFKSNS